MKLLPPANFQLFEAHRLDKRTSTSVGCFGGSRATRPVLELLRKPGAVARKTDYKRLVGVEVETTYTLEKSLRSYN